MSQKGKIQLTFIIIAPADQVAEGDRLFASHAPWMEKCQVTVVSAAPIFASLW